MFTTSGEMFGHSIALALFLIAFIWAVYAYLGYPLALVLLRRIRRRPIEADAGHCPTVSVIITVHNGADRIRRKLENVLGQRYPVELREIVVADDCSDDGTDRIVREEYGACGVRLVRLEQRGGKEGAQREALHHIQGEIVVFTDVGTLLDQAGLCEIVRPFSDASVGCVSSIDRVANDDDGSSGEGLYVRYEMALRRLESEVGSIVGLSGSFFAVRRSICEDFSERDPSDFRSVLVAVRKGLRAVSWERAVGHYADIPAGQASRARRIRTILRGLTTLYRERRMLNPFRYGVFAWQLWSHKLGRWTVAFALLLALASSAFLAADSRMFQIALAIQLAGLAYAFLVLFRRRPPRGALGRAVRYLAEANLSALIAWTLFLRGKRVTEWKPTAR
ncbi:MAG: glycosyltransferase [Acidobacteriota bacterium]|nr:MAG: glycosyltransferase [Acidobacteriota bacterium]